MKNIRGVTTGAKHLETPELCPVICVAHCNVPVERHYPVGQVTYIQIRRSQKNHNFIYES